MPRVVIAVVLLFAVLTAFVAVAPAEEPQSVRWETDLAAARARAAEEGRPLMVVFR